MPLRLFVLTLFQNNFLPQYWAYRDLKRIFEYDQVLFIIGTFLRSSILALRDRSLPRLSRLQPHIPLWHEW
jgi:hypothetical protein